MIEKSVGCRVAAGLFIAAAAFGSFEARGQAKPEESPLLRPIDQAHCLALYDVVELRLKGRGDDVASISTRNGLKDFFVTRPGVVDCSGQREIPWRDDKDRDFILSVLKEADNPAHAKLDMGKEYGIAPAPSPVRPIQPGR
jgi:hypothetical protein